MKVFFLPLFCILIVSFISCDGQDRKYKSPQEILQENKLLDSFSEKQVRFIPETYAEKVTDTIFDNGYKVHIKMYCDMYNYITVNSKDDSIKYRDFNLDIKVIKDEKSILSIVINKEVDIVYENLKRLNLDAYYLRDFWVAKNNKNHEQIPGIYFEYYSPASKDSSIIEIIPLENNDFLVTEIIN